MTWQEARKEAEERLRIFLENDAARGVNPREEHVVLGLHEDQESLSAIQPQETLPLSDHQQVIRATMRILRAHKYRVDIVKLSVADYRIWLDGREDSDGMKAEYLVERLKR
jgi:hypothetical protein